MHRPYSEEAIRAEYPQMAYLLSDQEMGQVLRDAYENDWEDDKFMAKVMSTSWWKRTSSAERDYQLSANADPATHAAKLDDNRRTVRQIAGTLGYDLDAGYIDYFADMMFRRDLDPDDLRALMVDEITPLIGTTEKSPILAQIREASQQWGIVLDGPTLNYWLAELGSGRQSIENLDGSMREQLKTMFPNLSNELDMGQTFRQIQKPYKDMVIELLEVSDESVDFIGDPKMRELLQYTADDGTTRKMSLVEAANSIRKDPRWRQTQNFKDRSDSVVRNLRGVFTGA